MASNNLENNKEFQKMIKMTAAYHADANDTPVSEIAKAIGRSEATTRKYIKITKSALG